MKDSIYCKYIINLYNKQKIYPKYIKIFNEILYIKNNIHDQTKRIIYLYKFNNNNKYYAVNDNKDIIFKIDNIPLLEFIWYFYGHKKTSDNIIDSIINKINFIVKKTPIFNNTKLDNDRLKKFLYEISTNNDAINDINCAINNNIQYILKNMIKSIDYDTYTKININNMLLKQHQSNEMDCLNIQYGGSNGFLKAISYALLFTIFPLWVIQKILDDYLPPYLQWIGWIYKGILEIIDIILGIASAIPGLQFLGGAGWIIDLISIIFAFARFDIVGVVAGIISLIPFVGDIGGLFTKMGGKGTKLVKYIFKPAKLILGYSDEFIDVIKFGAKYGDDAIDIINFIFKYSDDFVEIITKFMKYGNVLEMGELATKYGDEFADIVEFLLKHSEFLTKYGDEIIDIGNKITKYGDDIIQKILKLAKFGAKNPKQSKNIVSISKGAKKLGKEAIDITKEYAKEKLEEIQEDIKKKAIETTPILEKHLKDAIHDILETK